MRTKHLLVTVSILLFAQHSQAQIEKGNILLGGAIGFTNYEVPVTNVGNSKHPFSNLTLQVGSFIQDNKVIGVIAHYDHYYNESGFNPSGYDRLNGYGLGVFYRQYYHLNRKFLLFGEGDLEYSFSKKEQGLIGSTGTSPIISKANGGGLTLYP